MARKSIISIFLTVAIILISGVSGCMDKNYDFAGEAQKYLENKYHQKFDLVTVIYPSMDIPYAEILFSSDAYPNEKIVVCRDSGTFSDNYYGIMAKAVCRDRIQTILNRHIQDAKFTFYFTSSYFPDEAVDMDDFDSYRVRYPEHFRTDIHILVPSSAGQDQKLFDAVCSDLQSEHFGGYVALYPLAPEQYGALDSQESVDQYVDSYSSVPPLNTVIR